MDETDGWIFSDDGHQWMDERRRWHGGWSRPSGPYGYGSVDPRPGWEHGLFGLKKLSFTVRKYEVMAEDYEDGAVML